MSPSMLKSDSVTTNRWPEHGSDSSSCASASQSQWGKTTWRALDRRIPSIRLAWFSSSEKIKSSLVGKVESTPRFAAHPLPR